MNAAHDYLAEVEARAAHLPILAHSGEANPDHRCVWLTDEDGRAWASPGTVKQVIAVGLAREDVPRLAKALRAVLELWPDTTDPCPSRTCGHVDCETINAIIDALEVDDE